MRILHTMLRVTDIDKSIAFYTEVMGMKLMRKQDTQRVDLHSLLWATNPKLKPL